MDITKKAILATTFVQFRDPATDELEYATDDNGVAKTDEHGNKLPVGVKVYGPGSVQYRKAEAAITTENIKRGKKGMTGDTLAANATELLARTTIEFVNFNYEGASASLETNRKFYDDVRLAHYRAQVQEKQGDFGSFLATPTSV